MGLASVSPEYSNVVPSGNCRRAYEFVGGRQSKFEWWDWGQAPYVSSFGEESGGVRSEWASLDGKVHRAAASFVTFVPSVVTPISSLYNSARTSNQKFMISADLNILLIKDKTSDFLKPFHTSKTRTLI